MSIDTQANLSSTGGQVGYDRHTDQISNRKSLLVRLDPDPSSMRIRLLESPGRRTSAGRV
jgi:hypothetical protein